MPSKFRTVLGGTRWRAQPICQAALWPQHCLPRGSLVLASGTLGIFSVAISSFAAIEYSDSTLVDAEHLLLGLASFVEEARAYVKGQLTCGLIEEDALWER